jgi:hypothetical protein
MSPDRIRSNRAIEVLSKLVSVRGAPKHLRSDNGSESDATRTGKTVS